MGYLAVPIAEDLSVRQTTLFDEVAVGFLLGYDNARTRSAYQSDLRCFASWCAQTGTEPLTVQRAHLDLYARFTRSRRISAIVGSAASLGTDWTVPLRLRRGLHLPQSGGECAAAPRQ